MATAPSQYSLIGGASGNLPALAYKDANGSFANVTMPWVLNSSGILVPWPVDSNNNPQVSLTGSLALEADTFDVATTAGALPTQACNEVLIQAGNGNADNVSIGNSKAQPISLAPGQSVSLSIANLNLVYAVATATGNTLGWMVRS